MRNALFDAAVVAGAVALGTAIGAGVLRVLGGAS